MIETDPEEVRRWVAQAKTRHIGLKPVEIWLGQTDRRMGPVLAGVVKGLGIGGRFRTRATMIAKVAEAVGREERRLDREGEHDRVVLVGRRGKTATIAVSPGATRRWTRSRGRARPSPSGSRRRSACSTT